MFTVSHKVVVVGRDLFLVEALCRVQPAEHGIVEYLFGDEHLRRHAIYVLYFYAKVGDDARVVGRVVDFHLINKRFSLITLKFIFRFVVSITLAIEAAEGLHELNEGERVLAADDLGVVAAQHGHLRTERVLYELEFALFPLRHLEVLSSAPNRLLCFCAVFFLLSVYDYLVFLNKKMIRKIKVIIKQAMLLLFNEFYLKKKGL
jgi:hypothetical protein